MMLQNGTALVSEAITWLFPSRGCHGLMSLYGAWDHLCLICNKGFKNVSVGSDESYLQHCPPWVLWLLQGSRCFLARTWLPFVPLWLPGLLVLPGNRDSFPGTSGKGSASSQQRARAPAPLFPFSPQQESAAALLCHMWGSAGAGQGAKVLISLCHHWAPCLAISPVHWGVSAGTELPCHKPLLLVKRNIMIS